MGRNVVDPCGLRGNYGNSIPCVLLFMRTLSGMLEVHAFRRKSSNLSQCQINMSTAKCLKINVVSFEVKITSVLKRFTIIIEQATRRLMPAIFSFENFESNFQPAQNFFDKHV